ncbi:MAG: peptidoglycan DD-metalloendopeptidase family protein [Cyclobacteriaceae bacterium]|nr:peptidoglycan DD-metalloendopeptidase family protein [Cyclobacteriaceae bacterium]UYN86453.1 MAG: peptidoglycan DD-metalloendopeptidase family protein [Cyclobacteriaceae bacterium]
MTVGKKALLSVAFVLFVLGAVAQNKTKAQLQKEKQQNLEKIKEVEKILDETAVKKKSSLGELNALNQRIRIQENLIQSIKSEIGLLDKDISDNNGFILALEEDLKKLKEEYAAMLFAAQKANNSATRLTFLFSASSFDQLMMRLQYMRQYSERRKLQVEAIQQVQTTLGVQVKQIEARRAEKSELLKQEISENNSLVNLKVKQNNLVKSLEKQEKTLRKDLEDTRKALAVLDKRINEIIREEMERAARESKTAANAAALALSSSFEENKAKFPWPASGFISQKFGKQNHPVLKGIVIQNDGINIQTKENEKVKCIFEGEVRSISFYQIIGYAIIIGHGEYFTVYSGLKEVYVKKGQKVSTNQEIGQVLSNADGVSELRFQLRKNTTALDPQTWLRN